MILCGYGFTVSSTTFIIYILYKQSGTRIYIYIIHRVELRHFLFGYVCWKVKEVEMEEPYFTMWVHCG